VLIQNLSLFLSDKVSNRKIFSKLNELNKFYSINHDERQKIIFKKLSFTLKNAYENISYYYDLAEDNNLQEIFLNFKMQNLKDIPTINKDILRKNKKYFLRPDISKDIKYCYTNGSTGGRVSVAYDQEAMDWSSAVMIFCRGLYGHKLTNKEVHLSTDIRSRIKREQLSQFAKEWVNNRSNIFIRDFNQQSILNYLDQLSTKKTNLLHGMPSQVNGLIKNEREGFYIPLVETSGEVLSSNQRMNIENFFSTKVIDRYGLAESGIVAYQMPKQDNLSVIDFHTFVEVDNNGEIIVTNLNNKIMPLIRYRTGDFCNNKGIIDGFHQIKVKEGREHSIASYKGNKLNTASIEDIIFTFEEVKDLQFQLTQNREIINILIEIDKKTNFQNIQNKVNKFTNTDLGKIINLGSNLDFKLSGNQGKKLRVVILDK